MEKTPQLISHHENPSDSSPLLPQEHLESNTITRDLLKGRRAWEGKILLNICAIFKHQTKASIWSECLSLCYGNADPGTEQGCGKLFTICLKAMALLQDWKSGKCSASIFYWNCCRDKTWSKRKFQQCAMGKKSPFSAQKVHLFCRNTSNKEGVGKTGRMQ